MIPFGPKYSKIKLPVKHGSATCFLLVYILFVCILYRIDSAEANVFDTSKDNWAIIAGYGQSFPGWGQTTQRLETLI
jgi:hypothetical protein